MSNIQIKRYDGSNYTLLQPNPMSVYGLGASKINWAPNKDANEATASGWYYADLNVPTGWGHTIIRTDAGAGPNYLCQTAYGLVATSGGRKMMMRWKESNQSTPWTGWYKIFDADNLTGEWITIFSSPISYNGNTRPTISLTIGDITEFKEIVVVDSYTATSYGSNYGPGQLWLGLLFPFDVNTTGVGTFVTTGTATISPTVIRSNWYHPQNQNNVWTISCSNRTLSSQSLIAYSYAQSESWNGYYYLLGKR